MRQAHLPHLLIAVSLGFLAAASYGLDFSLGYYSVSDWLREGFVSLIIMSISAWVLLAGLMRITPFPSLPFTRLINSRSSSFKWIQTIPGQRAIWVGVILAIGSGLNSGLISMLYNWSDNELTDVLNNGLSAGIISGFSLGLSFGVTAYLVSLILDGQIGIVRLAERIHWTGRSLLQRHHVRISQTIAFVSFWIFGLSEGLNSWIYGGWVEGLNYMLSSGLSYGLGIGLSYWWLVGLYQGVKQEHLDDQDRRQFNQGIHRSLRNGALLSLLSAGIITGIAIVLSNALSIGLTTGLSFDLRYGLSEGLNDVLSVMLYYGLNDMLRIGLSIGWLSVFCGWLVVWAATGGLTIMRHYLLRLLLSKKRTFPFQAQRFLDDATARVLVQRQGGGYGFVHRRLLDYFADTALVPADASNMVYPTPSVPQSMLDSVTGVVQSENLQN